jgi:hypothetical protein
MMDYEQLDTGDFVTFRMRDGLPAGFGGTIRTGHVIGLGIDVLRAELLIELDDGKPPLYASHIAQTLRRDRAQTPALRRGR